MRVWNWVERLHDVLADASVTTFDYGSFNCGLFAARCCDAIREDGGAEDELRTHFTDEDSARIWVGANGGIEALVSERLGAPLDKWWRGRRGDLALVETSDGPAVGVSTGERIAVLSTNGLTFLTIDKATRIWLVD